MPLIDLMKVHSFEKNMLNLYLRLRFKIGCLEDDCTFFTQSNYSDRELVMIPVTLTEIGSYLGTIFWLICNLT